MLEARYQTREKAGDMQLRMLRDESRRLIANLQGRYVAETGIGSLKIRHNNVLGYYSYNFV